MPQAQSRRVFTVIAIAIGGYLAWALVHSITDIPTYNDFEVFHYVGGIAAGGDSTIYESRTPHQQRGPFIYPVSASVLFIPLSWLPHDLAGAIFSFVKVACLLLLWWGSIRFSGIRPRDALGYALTILAVAIMLHRAVASDVGNGQINIILAAASAGGVWLMMLSRRSWWIGSLLLAWAIAIKMTPTLLLAVPLLNRRWKAFGLTVVASVILVIVVPLMWFGSSGVAKMNDQYQQIAARFTFDWPAADEQASATEVVQFLRGQLNLACTGEPGEMDVLPLSISGFGVERLFRPSHRAPAFVAWLTIGLAIGVGYLIVRWWLFRASVGGVASRQGDWTWDLAMLCSLIVLLSPRVQKAHLVILIVPAGWLAARICNWFAPQSPANVRRVRGLGVAAYALVCALLFTSESVALPIPGFDEPARCLAFLGVVTLIGCIVAVGRIDERSRFTADS